MNKHDRAKMVHRLERRLADWARGDALTEVCRAAEAEVDRAVRAERRAWQDAEELRLASLRRAEDEMVERMRKDHP